jgi:hypothetical protein
MPALKCAQMIASIRDRYNADFTPEKYRAFLQDIALEYDHAPEFRIAETPVFIPEYLQERMLAAAEDILQIICAPDFKAMSAGALPLDHLVHGESDHTTFLQLDFGICIDQDGLLTPQLIEVQGFPSLYFYQDLVAQMYRRHFSMPDDHTHLFGTLDQESYIELLRRVIIGPERPEQVVLLEVEPHRQPTQIDFWGTRHHLGLAVKCVSEIRQNGRELYYTNEQGSHIPIRRIYNRVIFDELMARTDLNLQFSFSDDTDVHWVGHPHWFFRISKYTLPLIRSQYSPRAFFLNEWNGTAEELSQYVLKPLFSFSGSGVILNPTQQDIDRITKPEQYLLQKKVEYAPVVKTPTGPAKCEVRLLLIWEDDEPRPRIVNNLARLTKGEMVGVKYNKDKDWVGGSVGFFPSTL